MAEEDLQDADVQFELAQQASARRGPDAIREELKWLRKAARAGHPDALLNLGGHYRDGIGIRRDMQMARRCFEAAAKKGDKHAMTELGRVWLAIGRSAKDRQTALFWIHKGMKKGDWFAPHYLGRATEEVGDWRTAEKWYRRALESGEFVSGYRLAKHYIDCLSQRLKLKGIALMKRTIRRSHIDPSHGYTELGRCYLYGIGVHRSQAQAVKYLKRAAAGDREARELLKLLRKPKS